MRILAVDFGDARTGLALCDPLEMMASPVGVVQEKDPRQTARQVAAQAKQLGAEEIVVGHPINMNGTLGPRSQVCRDFSQALAELVDCPVRLWDERGTTVSAISYLNATNTRGKKRKAVVDAVAATIILDSYMAWRRNHPGQTPPEPEIPDGSEDAGNEQG